MRYSKTGLLAVLAGAAIVLSACSAAGATDSGNAAPNPAPSSSRAARIPGVSGQVAALNGSTAQVQTRTAQTAVTWTGSTTFEVQKSADATALATLSLIHI